MITRQYDLDMQLPAFSFIGQPSEECVFFDIETTGFKAAFSEVYLIGAAVCNAGRWRIFQWMSEHPSEEDALLRTFAAFARPYGCLIHFNGDRFDLPYLQEKYDAHKIPCSLPSLRSIDLFTQFKPLRSLLELDHMNQKSLESFLGIAREDRFSGGELIEVYRSFVRSPARHLSELLLLHNMEDVKGMLRLTDLFAYRQLDTLFPEVSARLLLPAAGSGSKDSSGCEAAPGSLEITCIYPLRFPVPVCKSTAWGTLLLQENMSSLQVLIRCGQLLHFFENYKEYYYLPEEDEAIHKSVASFVDKAYRVRATARTCYTKKTGSFLPVFTETDLPCFLTAYGGRQRYIELPENVCDPAFAGDYRASCLHVMLTPGNFSS